MAPTARVFHPRKASIEKLARIYSTNNCRNSGSSSHPLVDYFPLAISFSHWFERWKIVDPITHIPRVFRLIRNDLLDGRCVRDEKLIKSWNISNSKFRGPFNPRREDGERVVENIWRKTEKRARGGRVMERFFKRSHIRISIQLKITSRPYAVPRNSTLSVYVCVCVCVCVCTRELSRVTRTSRVNFINAWRWPFLIFSRARSTKRPFVDDLSRNCAGRRAFCSKLFRKTRPVKKGRGKRKTCS